VCLSMKAYFQIIVIVIGTIIRLFPTHINSYLMMFYIVHDLQKKNSGLKTVANMREIGT
jgi:hypothetical protein